MRRKYVVLFCISILTIPTSAQHINTARLDSLFDILSAKNRVMGSFAIAQNGQLVYKRAVGYSLANSSKRVEATDHTLYNTGSVSKMFTATMIFQLIDEGKLSLQTKLFKYYPQIPNADSITIEQLLNHSSGLFDVANDPEEDWKLIPHTKTELLDAIIKGKPHFKPGIKTEYNNTGYILMAWLIEKLTGQTFNQNLQSRICKKAGLKSTYSPLSNRHKKNEAVPYFYADDWEPIADVYAENSTGASNIYSTPEE
ncbi:MAG: class A beta-lactamase-related serine hydrolase, partial [Sphingobacteriaceae bacterium]